MKEDVMVNQTTSVVSLTPRRSKVRVLHRPPLLDTKTGPHGPVRHVRSVPCYPKFADDSPKCSNVGPSFLGFLPLNRLLIHVSTSTRLNVDAPTSVAVFDIFMRSCR